MRVKPDAAADAVADAAADLLFASRVEARM